jgi:hypothetical protein
VKEGIMNETQYQRELKRKIEELVPGCLVLKNDPQGRQGIPDILVLHNSRWAMLEVKMSATAEHQPNQAYYIDTLSDMSYASFIYPENEEEVLSELQRALGVSRKTCVS